MELKNADPRRATTETQAVTRRPPVKMTASTRVVGGVTIVDLSGRIVLGEGSAGVRDLVRELMSEGIRKILLNLRNVDYVDSSGLGELVCAFTSMRSQGGELKLLNVTRRVRSLLQITKLISVFEIADDEATSLSSFSPGY
jgi:anti-sigma B factor antagonist